MASLRPSVRRGILLALVLLTSPIPSLPLFAETGAAVAPSGDVVPPEERFWRWFARNAKALFESRDPSDPVLAELQAQITRVHPLLVGVIDGIRQDGRRIFIISAGGKREGFGAVRSLAAATPRFNRWKIFMYVPGRIRLRDFTAGDIGVRSSEVRALFYRGEPEGMVRIQLLIPGYTPDRDDAYREIARNLLFDAIGEYELATKVESILLDSADSPFYRDGIPLQGMPTRFNEYWYAVRRPR